MAEAAANPSCTGLTRASVIVAKKLDGRVKPGHDMVVLGGAQR
jgi:hypothetical protein